MKTKDLTICAFFTLLYILAAKITLPIGLIPFTLQTCVVILSALLLSSKHLLISYGLYLFMGLLGFPFFATGGGIAYILQPSFGFLLAFPIASCLLSYIRIHLKKNSYFQLFPYCLLTLLVIYIIAIFYMYILFTYYIGTPKDLSSILMLGITPFIISDTISVGIAFLCALRLHHLSIFRYLMEEPYK